MSKRIAPLSENLLPTSTQSLLGMPVRLYGPKGACASKINGFMIVSKKIPHFGEIQRWKEEKTPRKKIALNIYSEGLQTLIATTEKCSGDFAKDAKLPESPISAGKTPDKTTANMAKRAFKALPSYKTDIKQYMNEDYYESINTFEISHLGKTVTWVAMFAVSGNRHCSNESGELGALWKIEASPKGKRLRFVQYIDDEPEYATDIDNDGSPEFISRDSLVNTDFDIIRTDGSKKRDYHFKGSHDYDCPC